MTSCYKECTVVIRYCHDLRTNKATVEGVLVCELSCGGTRYAMYQPVRANIGHADNQFNTAINYISFNIF